MAPQNVILDADIGTDDAMALFILLLGEKAGLIKILAIVATKGNTTVANVIRNTCRLLKFLDITHIPIYKGAEEPLFNHTTEIDEFFHGIDGFGDLEHNEEPDLSLVSSKNAFVAISELVESNNGNVSLVCLGPLTNAAILLKTCPGLRLNSIAIMGGNFEGIGNITSSAEYNFYFDPEAARIVFETATCDIILMPWEPCLIPKIPMEWRLNIESESISRAWNLLTRAERKIYAKEPYWLPCDAFLAACFVFPERMIVDSENVNVSVETQGGKTRGQVVIDRRITEKPRNVRLIKKFHEEEFKNIVLETLNH